jgi:hypothetical protein
MAFFIATGVFKHLADGVKYRLKSGLIALFGWRQSCGEDLRRVESISRNGTKARRIATFTFAHNGVRHGQLGLRLQVAIRKESSSDFGSS